MIKLDLYSLKGVKKDSVNLPKDLEAEKNLPLLAQAVYVYRDRNHLGLSKVKTRSEVVASTRKIYRQKGTGGARHGDVKAPIFVGGGKAHGPKGVKRTLRLPDKMRRKAFKVSLSLKAKNGDVLIVESLKNIKKTKEAGDFLEKMFAAKDGKKDLKNVLVAISNGSKEVMRFFRNLSGVEAMPFTDLNALNLFKSRLVIIEKDALDERTVNVKTDTKSEKKVNKKTDAKKPKATKKVNKKK